MVNAVGGVKMGPPVDRYSKLDCPTANIVPTPTTGVSKSSHRGLFCGHIGLFPYSLLVRSNLALKDGLGGGAISPSLAGVWMHSGVGKRKAKCHSADNQVTLPLYHDAILPLYHGT